MPYGKADISVNYTVTFDSRAGSEASAVSAKQGSKISPPAAPVRTGYIFEGWYKEKACISAWSFEEDVVEGDITLYAKWTETAVTYELSATGGTISNPSASKYQFDERITVTADSPPAGKKFAYWSFNGERVSYSPTYSFYAAGDVSIEANYVDEGTEVEAEPVIRLENKGFVRDETDQSYSLYYIGQIVEQEGCTLVECGLLLSNQDIDINNFVIGEPNVRKVRSEARTSTGQFLIVVKQVPTGAIRPGRTYMIYKNEEGQEFTIYSSNTVTMMTPD